MAHVVRIAGEEEIGPIGLRDLRLEQLREVQARLDEFEALPTREGKGRLLQALDDLALLIRSERCDA